MSPVTKTAVFHFLLPGVNIFQWYTLTLCIYLCNSKLTHLICISKSFHLGIFFWHPTDEDFALFSHLIFQSVAPGLSTNLCTCTHILPRLTSSSHFVSIYIMFTLFWPIQLCWGRKGTGRADSILKKKKNQSCTFSELWTMCLEATGITYLWLNWPPGLINTIPDQGFPSPKRM